MTRAEAAAILRGHGQRLASDGFDGRPFLLGADALEAVERLEAEREQWKSIGAEEELRRLAAEWSKRGRERRMLAQKLEARADAIKVERDVIHAAE